MVGCARKQRRYAHGLRLPRDTVGVEALLFRARASGASQFLALLVQMMEPEKRCGSTAVPRRERDRDAGGARQSRHGGSASRYSAASSNRPPDGRR